jgi:predicted phage terminase large subunit-like protein
MTNEKIALLEGCPVEASQLLRTDFKLFIRVFHFYITKKDFIFKPFHNKIIEKLESIVYGEPRNLVISISPRFGKSAIMRYFVAWTYAINKDCNNIYTSYSDDLVRQFSGEIRDLINSPLYQKLFHLKIKEDTQNKGLWQIDGGGGVRACSMGGSITGFGAGNTDTRRYGGCILIDDPLKADDAHSETAKKACWNYFSETLLSRRNSETTPFIIIMQRLAVDDLVALIKKNNSDFDYVEIPVLDENKKSIWEERFSTETLLKIQREQPGFFAAQYMQNPIVEGGNLFKEEMFIRGPVPSEFTYTFITCDTASTSKTTSDYTVAGFWGVSIEGEERRLYLLDLLRDKIDSAQCEDYLVPFIKKHAKQNFVGSLIEPKGHGIYLNQRMPMYGVPMRRQDDVDAFFKDRKFDKVMRANIIIPHLVNNAIICGPEIGEGMFEECKNELLAFPDGTHDDFVDVLIDAVKFTYNREVSILDVL